MSDKEAMTKEMLKREWMCYVVRLESQLAQSSNLMECVKESLTNLSTLFKSEDMKQFESLMPPKGVEALNEFLSSITDCLKNNNELLKNYYNRPEIKAIMED